MCLQRDARKAGSLSTARHVYKGRECDLEVDHNPQMGQCVLGKGGRGRGSGGREGGRLGHRAGKGTLDIIITMVHLTLTTVSKAQRLPSWFFCTSGHKNKPTQWGLTFKGTCHSFYKIWKNNLDCRKQGDCVTATVTLSMSKRCLFQDQHNVFLKLSLHWFISIHGS